MAGENSIWNANAPLVIAHRGASFVCPENTLPAFEKALELGADAIELDVKLSKDGRLIVHHDQTLNRTTDGSGNIAEWTWKELKRLDAGGHKAPEFQGVEIPLLADVFERIGDKLLYNLELTEYRRPFTEIARKTVQLVRDYNLEPFVLYSSFNPLELFRISALAGDSQIALLMHENTARIMREIIQAVTPHAVYHPFDKLVSIELVESIHAKQKRINVWTINDSDRMQTLLKWGADGIITDLPDRAVEVRNRLGKLER